MRKIKILLILLFPLGYQEAIAQLFPNLGGTRAGISALTFLKTDVSPRASAMGGAQVSLKGDGYAAQWNPAGTSDLENWSFTASNAFMGAGINHSYFSITRPNQKYGNFTLSAVSLNSGAMEKRTEFQPNGTGEFFYVSNNAIGLTYSQALTERFSYGITLKYINELMDQFSAHTAMIDLGFLYRTNYKDLQFAVALLNFGFDSKLKGTIPFSLADNGNRKLDAYPGPSVFSMGVSMIPIKTDKHQLTTALQINHPGDNAANIRLGLEYGFNSLLFFRAGYKINVKDQYYPTVGVGLMTRLNRHPLSIDYSADPHPYLGITHRIGLNFQIVKNPNTLNSTDSKE